MASKIISINNNELLVSADFSSLKGQVVAGSATLTVQSIGAFTIDQVLLIGEFGKEGSEIIKTHNSTAPTGNTVTLASNTIKSHPDSTKVYVISYDQIVVSTATTVDGVKTPLSPTNIDAEKKETTYLGSLSSGYYFIQWFNSISSEYSGYSDPIPVAGFGSNTVSYLIDLALKETNKELSDKLTFEVLLSEINACLRYVRGKLKKWSNVQEFNYELDAATVLDDRTWTLPTSYYDKNSNRSCLSVWIEGEDVLAYVDKEEFDDLDRETSNGKPKYFTIYDGSIYITPKVGASYVGKKVYMDFYTDIVEVNSDADEISLARHDLVKYWLKWMVRNITENNGKLNFDDGDWKMFSITLVDSIRRESSGQKEKLSPKLNGIFYGGSNNSFDIE